MLDIGQGTGGFSTGEPKGPVRRLEEAGPTPAVCLPCRVPWVPGHSGNGAPGRHCRCPGGGSGEARFEGRGIHPAEGRGRSPPLALESRTKPDALCQFLYSFFVPSSPDFPQQVQMRQVFTFRENKNKMTKAALVLWIPWAGLVSPSLGLAPPECHGCASLPRGGMHSPQQAVNTQHGTTCPPPRGFPTVSGCPSSSHPGRQAREGPTPNPGFVSRLSPF